MQTKIKNPIIPGFNPDASVLKVGDDYYLTTSTFEWWPGVEIYHSRDLINWTIIANPLNRISQADLRGNYNSGSIWAPHLSFAKGKFWLIYTDVKTTGAYKDTLNYLISAERIEGPWSEPTFITASGFDPSLFHDDDGKSYVINMLFDHRLTHTRFAGLVIQELDLASGHLMGRRQHFFTGTDLGVCEGPQLMKKDGWYYLLCAAGGTGYSHAATICRSRMITGPYEVSPFQPLLTTKDDPDNPLQKAGHASFVSVSATEWYIVHIMARPIRKAGSQRGVSSLGRETALQPLIWENGWPRLANQTAHPDLLVTRPSIAQQVIQCTNHSQRVDFHSGQSLALTLKTLRQPLDIHGSLTDHPGYLRLYGAQSLTSLHSQALIARRWQSTTFRAETKMIFEPQSFQQMAGLVLFYDTDNYVYLQMSYDDEQACPYLQLETANAGEHVYQSEPAWLPNTLKVIKLAVEVTGLHAQFFFQIDTDWQTIGSVLTISQLSDEAITANGKLAFTGSMVGVCAQDLDRHTSYADFEYLDYQEQP